MTNSWVYQDTYKKQINLFVNECIETLTGYFRIINKEENIRVYKILSNIFNKSIKSIYTHGIIVHINQLNSLMDIFNTNDDETILGYIENVFNGE